MISVICRIGNKDTDGTFFAECENAFKRKFSVCFHTLCVIEFTYARVSIFNSFSLLLEMIFCWEILFHLLKQFESEISLFHRFNCFREVVDYFNHIGILLDNEYSLSRSNVCNKRLHSFSPFHPRRS